MNGIKQGPCERLRATTQKDTMASILVPLSLESLTLEEKEPKIWATQWGGAHGEELNPVQPRK